MPVTQNMNLLSSSRRTGAWETIEEMNMTSTPPSIYSATMTSVAVDNKIYIAGIYPYFMELHYDFMKFRYNAYRSDNVETVFFPVP